MAVCNVFKKLTKETGSFLTFSQYMEDLTIWQTESKYHRIVPSKFIAIDCKHNQYTNITFPKYIQEWFENACACFKNNVGKLTDDGNPLESWNPEYSKTLFWNMMFGTESFQLNEDEHRFLDETSPKGLINIDDIKYVGDINLQSYNNIDSMGYSEIYCHIPNESCSYQYSMYTNDFNIQRHITRYEGDVLEGFIDGELQGWEKLTTAPDGEYYKYLLDKEYMFSWDHKNKDRLMTSRLMESSYNINMIVVLYDIWNDESVIASGIPLGMYVTGLIDENNNIQNSITKYISNEDIYNTGTSYGLRICSRYIVSPGEDKYIVKDVSVEDNNYGDLSRVLSQLSISQAKMDEVINKTYNTEQNYKNLLAIFKNSRTNVPYIKVVNDEGYWFVNGKQIGPSAIDGVYDSYTTDEMDWYLDRRISQTFQILATARDSRDKYIFDRYSQTDILLKWDVYYEGKKIRPTEILLTKTTKSLNDQPDKIDNWDVTHTNSAIFNKEDSSATFTLKATFGQLTCSTSVNTYFVYPTYFGELKGYDSSTGLAGLANCIKTITKYTTNTPEHTFEITTDINNPGYICYAYPKEYGELSYIKDAEGYVYYDCKKTNDDEENSFKMDTVTLNPYSDKEDAIEYYVYINNKKAPVYVHNLRLSFKNLIQ